MKTTHSTLPLSVATPVRGDFRVVRSGRVVEVERFKARYWPQDGKIAADRLASVRRSRKMLRRLISSNAGQYRKADGRPYLPMFVTLTFRDGSLPRLHSGDMTRDDVSAAKRAVYLFWKRVNYAVYSSRRGVLKYSYVIEFGDDADRVHFHCLIYNLPFVPDFKRRFEEWWRMGYVRINAVESVRNAGAYVAAYLGKDFERLVVERKLRLHSSSIRLLRPVVFEGADARWWLERLAGVPPWFFKRGALTDFSIYYLGEDGLPDGLAPPARSPVWLGAHG